MPALPLSLSLSFFEMNLIQLFNQIEIEIEIGLGWCSPQSAIATARQTSQHPATYKWEARRIYTFLITIKNHKIYLDMVSF